MSAASPGAVRLRLDPRAEGGHVAVARIDRPHKLNALGAALFDAFADAIDEAGRDAGLRAVVVESAGERSFIGGADIYEMASIDGPVAARAFITKVHEACAAVRACPAPVIARIQGFCFGAGLELAAACDFRIAGAGARFGMPEVRLGIPSVVEAALLPGLIGWGRTRRLLLTGETLDATTALAWGLVEEVAPAAGLDDAVERALAALLACGPEAVRRQKALIGEWERLPLAQAIAAGIDAFESSWTTDEPRELMAGFLARQAARKR
jgi:enoyl-CoA hydratase